jgi:hypothetical protein
MMVETASLVGSLDGSGRIRTSPAINNPELQNDLLKAADHSPPSRCVADLLGICKYVLI